MLPNLNNSDSTLNLAFLLLICMLSLLMIVGAVLALRTRTGWRPAAITALIISTLSAATTLLQVFTHYQGH